MSSLKGTRFMVMAIRNLMLVMAALLLGSQQAMCACSGHSGHGASAAHAMEMSSASADHCADMASAPSDTPQAECHPDTPFLAKAADVTAKGVQQTAVKVVLPAPSALVSQAAYRLEARAPPRQMPDPPTITAVSLKIRLLN